MKETTVAKKVVRYLEREGWEVFKEVYCPKGRYIVDLYARKEQSSGRYETWAIEVKTHFGLDVMEQAHNWQRYAHRASVAVPVPKSKRARAFGYRVCNEMGIGVIEVASRSVDVRIRASRSRRPTLPTLREEQKKATAGAQSDANRWTPLDETKQQLADLVAREKGLRLRDAITRIDHHYRHDRSAFSSLRKHIRRGNVPNVRAGRGSNPKLYPR